MSVKQTKVAFQLIYLYLWGQKWVDAKVTVSKARYSGGKAPNLLTSVLNQEKEPLVTIWLEGGWASKGSLYLMAKRKIHAPARNQTPVIKPIASHFNDWAYTYSYKICKNIYHSILQQKCQKICSL